MERRPSLHFLTRPGDSHSSTPPRPFVSDLLDQWIMLPEEWTELPQDVRTELEALNSMETALPALVRRHLLTRYQAEVIHQGDGRSLILGQYRLLERLGRGGMAVVYRAEHLHLRHPVAIKVLTHPANGNRHLVQRFLLEARAIARLRHPNIVACFDAGQDGPHFLDGPVREYCVMDLVPGADLQASVTAHGPLPVHCAAGLFHQVAEALVEVHRLGLVHRDVKPSNIRVTPDWKAKLLDFGLVRHRSTGLTVPGAFIGSIGYMAPEQIDNPSKVDGRADVFAFGASLFLVLTGVEPFPTLGQPAALIYQRLQASVPHIRQHRPELPAELDALVARLMDPDVERRIPSSAAAAAAILPFTQWRPESNLATGDADRPRI